MTSKERLYCRMKGGEVDKVPNLNITMLFAAEYAKIPYDEYCSDYIKLVEAQTVTAHDFGIDILSVMSDPLREASDFGCDVIFVPDDLPRCRKILLKEPSDYKKLKRWNPLESVRMLDRIRAVELFKQNSKEEYPILGWVEGALAELSDLADISEVMVWLFESPDIVKECLEIITQQQIACAMEQIKAGADIIGIGDACASLIGSGLYKQFALPYEKRIIDAIHAAGAKAKLHICGNITSILEDVKFAGMDILDLDYMVDLEKAAEIFKGTCSLCGNINPTEVLLQGRTTDVERALADFLGKTDNTSIVSSGCEVPRMSPIENVKKVDYILQSSNYLNA